MKTVVTLATRVVLVLASMMVLVGPVTVAAEDTADDVVITRDRAFHALRPLGAGRDVMPREMTDDQLSAVEGGILSTLGDLWYKLSMKAAGNCPGGSDQAGNCW